MLTYKQRYRPRTTREYTKSDLAVYDSADNTALNALTVYGKSEVVDGAIKSAGDSGSIEVRTSGKNLFGGLPFATALNNKSSTSTIDTVNKTVTFNHASISDPANYVVLYTGGFKENTVYSFIFTGNVMTSTGHNTSLVIYYTDGTREQIIINSKTKQTVKTVSSINKTIKDFGFSYYGDALSILYYDECGLFEGDIAVSAYEPYTGTMAVFETGTPLYGVSDTARDVMTWDGSEGTVTKNCGAVDLGTLNWSYKDDSAPKQFRASLPQAMWHHDYNFVENIICPLYQTVSYYNFINSGNDNLICRYYTTVDGINIVDNSCTTLSQFLDKINGVMLVYELATPTTQPLTQTENESIAGLRTFSPQTHISNNAGTDMTVNYTIRVPTIN